MLSGVSKLYWISTEMPFEHFSKLLEPVKVEILWLGMTILSNLWQAEISV